MIRIPFFPKPLSRGRRAMIEPLECRQFLSTVPSLPLPISAFSTPWFIQALSPSTTPSSNPVQVQVLVNQQYSGVVAHLSNFQGDLQNLSASITWGDGSAAVAGTITAADDGGLNVIGQHTYATTGAFVITVALFQPGPNNTTVPVVPSVKSGALVNNATGGQYLAQYANNRFTASLGVFQFNNDSMPLKGTITWGDGSTSDAVLQRLDGGRVNVLGTHEYAKKGVFNVTVKIKSSSAASTTSGTLSTDVADLASVVYALPSVAD